MKRKLGWFGLGFAGAELAAAILPPLVCVPAAAFLVCLALLGIKRRRDSAIPVLGALCGLAWFLVFTLVWVRPVKALAGQTVTCTAVVETDADVRILRRALRDVRDRGRTLESVITQYLTTVKPMHEQFVEPSKKNANLIVPEGGKNLIALEMIINRIQKHIDMA